jgi:hypothetical protein
MAEPCRHKEPPNIVECSPNFRSSPPNPRPVLVDNYKMKQISALGALLVATLLMGCHSSEKTANEEFFTPTSDKAELDAFYDRQVAAETYADPSLYAVHFTGDNLNSLGKAKLDSLLASCERPALVEIYLTGSPDTPEHHQAITKYLASHGCKADQFAFVTDPNPNSYTLARRSIADLDKMSDASSAGDSGGGGNIGGSAPGK